MKRDTNKQRAQRLSEIGALSARYVSEEGLEIYTGISAKTFAKLRGETPKRWSMERIKEEIARGKIAGPPYIEVGEKKIYDLNNVDQWMTFFPQMGILPDMSPERV